ncbi:MAG: hypothetical protein RJB13_971, partial [Pseudomonadota bacterium]
FISEKFSGVRTMPICDGKTIQIQKEVPSSWRENPFSSPAYLQTSEGLNISALSRETVIDETLPNLFSIYGGKYTTYRAECEKLAGRICRRLGAGGQSATRTSESWFIHELLEEKPEIFKTSPHTRSL